MCGTNVIHPYCIWNIESKISGRAKSFYVIYKKMIKKGLKFEEIRDLSAIRIIVKN
ncbi:MAG: bifunctional (p)ppGpp synthetase/guanosine-3',5'-bis(diphosphate) 3'-pyrophosphohydrolase, partial [Bacteroidetes bacterium]|nr:bifunctional (p)ppGpp synthetase/guanosine-3',5'-bis(diphosphate) 3'-pyrophosphohydrolase [Bacteroidota bacterium]